jgi:hypothetical protein
MEVLLMKCSWSDCQAVATHLPKICVPALGHALESHQPLGAILNLPACLEHAKAFDVQEFLNLPAPKGGSTNRILFEILARGKCPPDFDRAYVQPVPLDSEEAQMVLEKQ